MKEKVLYHGIPIVGRMPLFTAEMRQAVRDDRKTQTRRMMDPQPRRPLVLRENGYTWDDLFGHTWKCPHGKVGDVRCMCEPLAEGMDGMAYYRDDIAPYLAVPAISLITGRPLKWRWKKPWLASIHMPTEAARTVCRITDIRVEKLQEISEEDINAEGVAMPMIGPDYEGEPPDPWTVFSDLWNSINAKRGYGWDVPQMVWVDVFEKLEV